jgi:hypothetical protein
MASSDLDLEGYAALRARLARDGADRDALLAEYGFDEESWDLYDDRWQAKLSRALDQSGDDVPAEIVNYAAAFAREQRDAPGRLVSLELFAQCTRAVQGTRDPKLALEKLGVTLTEYLKANQSWSPQIVKDRAIAARFHAAMKGPALLKKGD